MPGQHGITGMRLAIAVTTLVGSSLSAIGAGLICLCYLFLPPQPHFRHRLIQNLAIADFLNAISTSTSGFYRLVRNRDLPEGLGCKLNGLATQITVQATDLSILAIAIVTVWVVTKPTSFGSWSAKKSFAAISFIWLLPFLTGFTALAENWYHPASGNWCWIQKKPVYLRYALTHGWRFLVIISVVILYAYLHIFLLRNFSALQTASARCEAPSLQLPVSLSSKITAGSDGAPDCEESVLQRVAPEGFRDGANPQRPADVGGGIHVQTTMTVSDEDLQCQDRGSYHYHHYCRSEETGRLGATHPAVTSNISATTPSKPTSPLPKPHHTQHMLDYETTDYGRKVSRALLMRGYPTFYVILWIPGIANRMVEACGSSSKVLQLMQASTQFIGLANAITYGLNEKVVTSLRERFRKRRPGGLGTV